MQFDFARCLAGHGQRSVRLRLIVKNVIIDGHQVNT